jgi:hypothetical protein
MLQGYYQQKYLKYKTKYLALKSSYNITTLKYLIGGMNENAAGGMNENAAAGGNDPFNIMNELNFDNMGLLNNFFINLYSRNGSPLDEYRHEEFFPSIQFSNGIPIDQVNLNPRQTIIFSLHDPKNSYELSKINDINNLSLDELFQVFDENSLNTNFIDFEILETIIARGCRNALLYFACINCTTNIIIQLIDYYIERNISITINMFYFIITSCYTLRDKELYELLIKAYNYKLSQNNQYNEADLFEELLREYESENKSALDTINTLFQDYQVNGNIWNIVNILHFLINKKIIDQTLENPKIALTIRGDKDLSDFINVLKAQYLIYNDNWILHNQQIYNPLLIGEQYIPLGNMIQKFLINSKNPFKIVPGKKDFNEPKILKFCGLENFNLDIKTDKMLYELCKDKYIHSESLSAAK